MFRSSVSKRLQRFGTSVFTEMTALAVEHDAVNLSQGTPDFQGPDDVIDEAERAMSAEHNQYIRSMGHPQLVRALAEKVQALYGLEVDPISEIVVTCGATEAIASSLLGLLNEGDEVILFEPFYDSYPPCVELAGATARYYTLRWPDFAIDFKELEAMFNDRTRLIVVNTPHNPTGKVFTTAELSAIAELCLKHNVLCLTDEVYEHMTYGEARHVPMATLPGMFDRTLTLSSAGKTYSLTGWKVGWAMGPAKLVAATQAAHQFFTYCTPGPMQLGIAYALRTHREAYYAQLRSDYQRRRDLLVDGLRQAGFRVSPPDGTYFALADFTELSDADDRSFAHYLTKEIGVAAIPPSAFYQAHPEEGRHLLRFSFCKRAQTIEQAASRLGRLVP